MSRGFTSPPALAWWLSVAVLLALGAAFRETWADMAHLWSYSRDYNYGWLVLPACAWMIWRLRHSLATVEWRPNWLAVLVAAVAAAAWVPASLLEVNVVAQLAVIALTVLTILAVFGSAIARVLWFPLCFAFLAVPFGEALVPALMEWTATATVNVLRFLGVYVSREGMFFATTAGDFAVAEACSGLRYLTASVTVSALYAYFRLRTARYQLALVAMSVVFALIGNVIRACLLVGIAHVFGMQHVVGVDHYVHGTAFFAVIAVALIALGHAMARREARATAAVAVTAATSSDLINANRTHAHRVRAALVIAGALIGIAVLARQYQVSARDRFTRMSVPLTVPQVVGEWTKTAANVACQPINFAAAVDSSCARYVHPRYGTVTLGVARGTSFASAVDLTRHTSRAIDPRGWRLLSAADRAIGPSLVWSENVTASAATGVRIRTLHAYHFETAWTSSRYPLTARLALAALRGRVSDAPRLYVVLSEERPGADREVAEFAAGLAATVARQL